MSQLVIQVLGSPHIIVDGRPLSVDRRKAMALLIYLAVTGQPHSRDALATLFWPDYDQTYARGNLRRTLSVLKKALDGRWLTINRANVAFTPDDHVRIDLVAFEGLIAAGGEIEADLASLNQAISLYRQGFLSGFTLPDCPDFDAWQRFQTDRLQQSYVQALIAIINGQANQGAWPEAIDYAQQWLAVDPLHEPAHRQLMTLYAQAGQQTAALRQYEQCVHLFKQELGVSPDPATTTLYEQIQHGEWPEAAPASPPTIAVVVPEPKPSPALASGMRLVTALVVKYTPLTPSTEPEALVDFNNQLLDLILTELARYEAHTEPFVGQGIAAIFGMPQTHEDDAERAIRAALAIRTLAQQQGATVTIGMNTGMVYAGQVGNNGHQTISAIGPVVDWAISLHHQAQADQIWVGEATYQQTQRAFRFSQIRNQPEDEAIYAVIRPRLQASKARGLANLQATLIGRDAELSQLQASLNQTIQGDGQVVSLIGEAGLGKSRLVNELRLVQPTTARWLEGRCLEMSQTISYRPFIHLLQQYFAWNPTDSEPKRANQVVTTLQAMGKQGLLDLELLDVMAPIFGNLLSLRFGNQWDQYLEHASPEQMQFQTFQTLTTFLQALAQQQPLVLVFEDLHWADTPSLNLLTHLMETVPSVALLMFCVYRPEPQHRSWQLARVARRKLPGHFTEIALQELPPQDSTALLAALLNMDDLPDRLKTEILARAHGNPFFMEEVLRSFIDNDLLIWHSDGWQLTAEIDQFTISDQVQGVILSRVDRLTARERQVLQSAAVIGRHFPQHVLAPMLDHEAALDELLWTLEDLNLIHQEQTVPEVIFAFHHVLTQEAIYQTLLPRHRQALHQQAGEILEDRYAENPREICETLAHHFERGVATAKAIDYLHQAGQKAEHAYQNDEAIDYYSRAITLTPDDDWLDRYELLLARANLYGHLDKSTAQLADLAAAKALVEAMDDGTQPALQKRATVLAQLAGHYQYTANYSLATQFVTEAIDLAQQSQAFKAEAMAYRNRSGIYWDQAKFVQAQIYYQQTVLKARQANLPLIEALALEMLAATGMFTSMPAADILVQLEAALQLYTQHNNLTGIASIHNKFGYLPIAQGDVAQYEQALTHYQTALQMSQKTGMVSAIGLILNNLIALYAYWGNYAQAKATYEQSRRIATEINVVWSLANTHTYYAVACLNQGQYEMADTLLKKGLAIFREIGRPHFMVKALNDYGLLLHYTADYEAALLPLNEAVEITRKMGDRRLEAQALTRLGHVLVALNREAEAKEAYTTAFRYKQDLAQYNRSMEAKAGLARLAFRVNDLAEAVRLAEEIVAHLENNPLEKTTEACWVHLSCYRVLKANDDPRARDMLTTAHTMLQERAATIEDETERQQFWDNVAAHREISGEVGR